MKRTTTLLLLLSLLLFPALTLAGGPVKVFVRVDGISCPFCAYGIEKKVKKLEGVEDVRVDLEGGKVVVIYGDEKFFTSRSLEEAVKDAGFTPGKIEIKEIE